jgi:acyl-CoA hydrolase
MNVQQMYKDKLTTPEIAAKCVQSGDLIYTPSEANEPTLIWEALADRKDELFGVRVRQFLTRRLHRYISPEFSEHIKVESLFVTGPIRPMVHAGYATYMPFNFSDMPAMVRQGGCDVLMATVTPMDEHGYFCYGLGCDYTPACVEVARNIIVEVNPNMPWTGGYNKIHITQVDHIIEDNTPIFELQQPTISAMDEKIAAPIAERIADGSTLQVGIGGIPAAVCKYMLHRKDLGMHTELVTDYINEMMESGCLNGSKKTIHKGKVIATIVEGTKPCFDYIANHPAIEFHPVDYTNNPYIIAQNNKMISINGTIEVDLFGQCCSETMGPKIYGGIGGQLDYARGAPSVLCSGL